MTGVDWAIILGLLLSVALSASQGFFYEVFSLAGVVVGYLVAAWEYESLAQWFMPYVKATWVAEVAAFFAVFLAVVLAAGILGRIARWLLKKAGLRWFDRLLGGAFGLVRGVLMVTVIVLAVASFTPGSRWLADSSLGPYFLVMARGAIWVAPAEVRNRFRQGVAALQGLTPQVNSEGSGTSAVRR
jgi:membrane protein required for colicin V production